jgi:ATP-binding cassette, subfamily G (WHITE), member 2
VVDILAKLAQHSVNVVMSIHQPRPDILRLIERVLVLSGSGTLLFTGPISSIGSHLAELNIPAPPSTLNLADFLLDSVIAATEGELVHMVAHFSSCILYKQESAAVAAWRAAAAGHEAALKPKYVATFPQQCSMLSAGLLRNAYRHPFLVATSYAATLLAALALGIAFWDSGFNTQVRSSLVASMILYQLYQNKAWRDDIQLCQTDEERNASMPLAHIVHILYAPMISSKRMLPRLHGHVGCLHC